MKSYKLSALFIILLLISGCSFFQKKEVPQAQPVELKMEKKIGIVSYGDPFSLIDAEGISTPIFSLTVNLQKYERRRVEAEGSWNENKTLFTVENIVSLSNETQNKAVYQSDSLGIKFLYPSLWQLKENKSGSEVGSVDITPYPVDESGLAEVETMRIERLANPQRLEPRAFLKLEAPDLTTTQFQDSLVGASRMPGLKMTPTPPTTINVYVNRDTFMYVFSHKTVGDADKDMYRNAFFDLLASFEFIPFKGLSADAAKPAPLSENIKDDKDLAALQQEVEQEKAKTEKVAAAFEVRQKFLDYFNDHDHISALAPESSVNIPPWKVSVLELVINQNDTSHIDGAYLIFTDGSHTRKMLLTGGDGQDPATFKKTAYFKPGDQSDWVRAEGEDTLRSREKTVIRLDRSYETAELKPGMSLLELKNFKATIQYPSSWYWAYSKTSKDASGTYIFSKKPVTEDNKIAFITMGEEIFEMPADVKLIEEDGVKYYTGASTLYFICTQQSPHICIDFVSESNTDIALQMIKTIQLQK